MGNLYDHARRELKLAEIIDHPDCDSYDKTISGIVLKLIETVADAEITGYMGNTVLSLFERLVRFEHLTPLTSNPDEWQYAGDCDDEGNPIGDPLTVQNRRNPAYFSKDGGTTWYHVHGGTLPVLRSKVCEAAKELTEEWRDTGGRTYDSMNASCEKVALAVEALMALGR